MTSSTALRSIVMLRTGQDVSQCCSCDLCEELTAEDGDVSVSMLNQWILANDERALSSATTWSDAVRLRAANACTNQLNIPAVLLALREEACRRGLR